MEKKSRYPDEAAGRDDFRAFATAEENNIDEAAPGQYAHVQECRITEWPVAFLNRPRRTANTIPDFLSPDAPANRLEILRGNVPS